MSSNDPQERLRSAIWKAVAHSDINFGDMPKDEQERLVELVISTALVELDDELGRSLPDEPLDNEQEAGVGDEKVIWEGRPFLSISERYTITSERVRITRGLLGKEREDVELVRIQDIDQKQTFRERLISVGDVNIRSHDRSHPLVILNNVRDPEKVHELLRRAVLEARKRHGLIYREEM